MTATPIQEKEKPSYAHISDVFQNHNPLDIKKNHCLKRTKRRFQDPTIRQYEVINLGIFVKSAKSGSVLQKGEFLTIKLV